MSSYMLETLHEVERAAADSRRNPQDHDKARQFLDIGMALTYQLCSQFMNDVTQKRQERHFGRDFASNLGTGISAALNLTRSSNLATGATSALFGGIDSIFQSWDKHYVATVDMAAAEALMRSDMADQASRNREAPALTFGQAEIRLIEYFNTCSFNGIKRLVNRSVVAATNKDAGSTAVASKTNAGYQAAAFQALALCRWKQARESFEAADAQTFGVNFLYSTALQRSDSRQATEVFNLSRELAARGPTGGTLPPLVLSEMQKCAATQSTDSK